LAAKVGLIRGMTKKRKKKSEKDCMFFSLVERVV
jgi:hypothetical protein